jgi:hypothetical protein
LTDKIYQSPRFEPVFKAGGIVRNDAPLSFNGIAAARVHNDGRLELLLNHPKIEDAVRKVIDLRNDPLDWLHQVFQEELLHHAANLTRRDQWQRATAQGKTREGFIGYQFRRADSMIDNLLAARDRAANKGNHTLAQEITDAIRH